MGFTRHERPTPIDANPLRSQEGLPVSIVSKACFFCLFYFSAQTTKQTDIDVSRNIFWKSFPPWSSIKKVDLLSKTYTPPHSFTDVLRNTGHL